MMLWFRDLDEMVRNSRPSVALQSVASVLESHISALTFIITYLGLVVFIFRITVSVIYLDL